MQTGDNKFVAIVPVELLVSPANQQVPDELRLLEELNQQYKDGLVTLDEAMRIMEGRQVWQ